MKFKVKVKENNQRIIEYVYRAVDKETARNELIEHYKYCLDYGILLEYEIVEIRRVYGK